MADREYARCPKCNSINLEVDSGYVSESQKFSEGLSCILMAIGLVFWPLMIVAMLVYGFVGDTKTKRYVCCDCGYSIFTERRLWTPQQENWDEQWENISNWD